MNHNLRLNDLAAETVRRAIDDINAAISAASSRLHALGAHVNDYGDAEVLAALGTIRDASWRVSQIVFHTDRDDSEYGIDTSRHPSRHRVRIVDDAVDDAPPHGIERPFSLVRCADDCTCKGTL